LCGYQNGSILTAAEYLFIMSVGLIPNFGYNYEFEVFARYTGVYWCVSVLLFAFEVIRSKSEDKIDYLSRIIARKNKLEEDDENLERWLGIYSRYGFLSLGDVFWKQATRDRISISVLMIDIDDFTGLVKKYGHWACEDILKQITEIIQSNVRRPLDVIGRYKHNTYSVMLYSSDAKSALAIAERIRNKIDEYRFEHKGFVVEIRASVSIGLATQKSPDFNNSLEKLASRALDNLKIAKDRGRNCIHFDESENGL